MNAHNGLFRPITSTIEIPDAAISRDKTVVEAMLGIDSARAIKIVEKGDRILQGRELYARQESRIRDLFGNAIWPSGDLKLRRYALVMPALYGDLVVGYDPAMHLGVVAALIQAGFGCSYGSIPDEFQYVFLLPDAGKGLLELKRNRYAHGTQTFYISKVMGGEAVSKDTFFCTLA